MLDVGISSARDRKTGKIVAYGQGASFSASELKEIARPLYRYELWSSRGYSPIDVIYANTTSNAKEYARAKYRMRGLHLEKVKTSRRKV